jgi:hypothetical protein
MMLSLWLCVLPGAYAHARNPYHLQHWYPQYAGALRGTIRESCCVDFKNYLSESAPDCFSLISVTCLSGRVSDCILSNTAETMKANMAAAGVLLGFLPTILSFVGSNTTEAALLGFRSPLFAFLAATGAPAVASTGTFEYRDSRDSWKTKDGLTLPQPPRISAAIIIVLEYLSTCASMVSSIVCRAILMLEISSMSNVVRVEGNEDG